MRSYLPSIDRQLGKDLYAVVKASWGGIACSMSDDPVKVCRLISEG